MNGIIDFSFMSQDVQTKGIIVFIADLWHLWKLASWVVNGTVVPTFPVELALLPLNITAC
jgi:hypothetical protein